MSLIESKRSKVNAIQLVEAAIKDGALIRSEYCFGCGSHLPGLISGRTQIMAHHWDYNRPLDVMWLCRRCHHKWHEKYMPISRETTLGRFSAERQAEGLPLKPYFSYL